MPVKDADLMKMIAQIGDHYQRNINNRYIRQALSQLMVPQTTWEHIERLTTKSGYSEANGFQFEELYEMILSAANLVSQIRKHLLQNTRPITGKPSGKGSPGDRGEGVLREMAYRNLPANLGIFADQVNELYMKTIELDKRDHANKKCVYERMPELRDIGRLLIGSE